MAKLLGAMLVATLLALPAAALAEEGGHVGWFADYDAAVAAAKDEGKNLLVDFTGSDWCGWCQKLKAEVFDHAAFTDGAKAGFVLVALDFPRGEEAKAAVPHPERNAELRDKYGISGYPTILLLTPEGEVFGRTGYQPGGPEAYLAHLEGLRGSGLAALKEVKEFAAKYAAAEGEARTSLLDEAIGRLSSLTADAIGGDTYADIARAALAATGEGAAERKRAAVSALMGAGRVDAEVEAAAKELDPKNEAGLLEKLVDAELAGVSSQEQLAGAVKKVAELDALGPIKDREIALRLYVNAAFWNYKFLKDLPAAKTWAKKARDLGTDNPRLASLLDEILGA